MKNDTTKIIYSAIQPTGRLHLGNYFGALRNFVTLQTNHRCFFAIADLHSLTEDFDPKEKQNQILSLAMDYLAIGLDPKKCTIFVQSHVPEVCELAWIFNCLTPLAFLERMTQFKDKALRQKKNINAGLLDYPVLQSADILMFRANTVPVGVDQVQHVELARDIAGFFNNKFGATFQEPQPLLTESPKIMSLTDPLKKMSKSMGEKSYIALADEPEVVAEKLAKAVTEPTGAIDEKKAETDAGMRGALNLLEMLKLFGNIKEYNHFKKAQKISYKELKEAVAKEIVEHFALYRKNKKALEANPEKVKKILSAGAASATKVAQKTMEEVRKKVGIRQ
jgi:tryptophanyl-tRNA synthetase